MKGYRIVTRHGELESRALQMIFEKGEEGILQSELWKMLGFSSREGSRLALKFERRGLIERRRVLHKGRWTYRLISMRKNVSLKLIADCPCLLCVEMEKCSEGGHISPISCNRLTNWILLLVKRTETNS